MADTFITLLLILLFSFLFFKWFTIFFHCKYENQSSVIAIIAYSLACVLLRLIVNQFSGSHGIASSELSSSLEIIFDIIFIIILFEGNIFKKCTIYVLTTMLLPLFLTALVGTINSLLKLPDNSYIYEQNSYINFFTVHILSYVVILIIEEHIRKKRYKTKNYFISIIFLVIAFQFLMHYYFSYMTKISESKEDFVKYQLIYAFSIIIFFCICIMYEKSIAVYHNTLQMNHQIEFYEFQSQLYEDSIRSLKENRKLQHDFKNHLITIQDFLEVANTSQASSYISDLLSERIGKSYIIDNNNATVSAILTYKKGECIKKGIKFYHYLEYKELNIAPIDITILLGNLLDNAIEACMKLDASIEKIIRFEIQKHESKITIICSNPYDTIPQKNGKLFFTSKTDSKMHGLGLGNIKDVVQKYDGDMDISIANKMFIITLFLNNQPIE